MRTIGIILTIVGVLALAYSFYDYTQQSESFKLLGAEITVSGERDLTPLFVSGGVLLIGLVFITLGKRK
ncbi:MAG: transglycosylase [Catalinimonas sp.]